MRFSKLSWLAVYFTPLFSLTTPGLPCGTGFPLVVVSRSSSLIVPEGLLTAVVSLVAEPGVEGVRASVLAACRLRSRSSWARSTGSVIKAHGHSWPCGMWDPPRSGIEAVFLGMGRNDLYH